MAESVGRRGGLPSPPFILVPGLPNMRDIGGLPVAGRPGKVIRKGLVFRSSEPSKVTDEGVSALTSLGITHVYDLRSEVEIQKMVVQAEGSKPREWPGAQRIFVPVFPDQDFSPEALAKRVRDYTSGSPEGWVRAYDAILAAGADADHPHAPFATILRRLAVAPPQSPSPLLIHCTAGKDRTGVICALILSLCGVEDEVVAHEYSLTELGLRERREEILTHLLKQDALGAEPENMKELISARKENMMATLAMIKEKYGSAERFLIDRQQLQPFEIEQIRQNLVVDAGKDSPILDWQAHAELVRDAE